MDEFLLRRPNRSHHLFQSLYNEADRNPIEVARLTWHSDPSLGLQPSSLQPNDWRLVSTPARDRMDVKPLRTPADLQSITAVQLIDGPGRFLRTATPTEVAANGLPVTDLAWGIFFVQLQSESGPAITPCLREF